MWLKRLQTAVAIGCVNTALIAIPPTATADAQTQMAACDGKLAGADMAARVTACSAVIAAPGAPKIVVASAHFRRGNVYLALRDYNRAVADYDQTLAIVPNDPLVLNNRCWARAVQGRQLRGALSDCDQVVKSQPNSPVGHDSRAFVLLRLGRFDAAIEEYDTALNQNPHGNALQASSLYGRGVAEAKKGDAVDSDTDIQLAASIAPGIARIFASYGVAP